MANRRSQITIFIIIGIVILISSLLVIYLTSYSKEQKMKSDIKEALESSPSDMLAITEEPPQTEEVDYKD